MNQTGGNNSTLLPWSQHISIKALFYFVLFSPFKWALFILAFAAAARMKTVLIKANSLSESQLHFTINEADSGANREAERRQRSCNCVFNFAQRGPHPNELTILREIKLSGEVFICLLPSMHWFIRKISKFLFFSFFFWVITAIIYIYHILFIYIYSKSFFLFDFVDSDSANSSFLSMSND